MDREQRIKAERAARGYAQWSKTLAVVALFITVEGRRPSTHSEFWGEPGHAGWLTLQRRQLREGLLGDQRQAALDAAIPGWNVVQAKDAKWWPQASVALAFQATNGRSPHEDAADSEERTSGRWLAKQRKLAAAGTMPEDHRTHLDSTFSGWQERPAPIPQTERRTIVRTGSPKHHFRYQPDVPGEERFEGYPRALGGNLVTLRKSASAPLGIPQDLLDDTRPTEWLTGNSLGDALPFYLESVRNSRLRSHRPGTAGANALFVWVEWAEYQLWLDEDLDGFHHGLLCGAVTLMGSALHLPADDAHRYAAGRVPARALYEKANDLAITHGVRAADLDLWATGVEKQADGGVQRGMAVAGAALSGLDSWWGFRDMPKTTAGMH
jgi:hypothetical protein